MGACSDIICVHLTVGLGFPPAHSWNYESDLFLIAFIALESYWLNILLPLDFLLFSKSFCHAFISLWVMICLALTQNLYSSWDSFVAASLASLSTVSLYLISM